MQSANSYTEGIDSSKRYWGFIFVFIIALGWFVISTYTVRGLFEYVGIDFRLWYSTGMIAKFHDFNQIYNSNLQAFYQKPLFDMATPSNMSMQFWPLPLPYFSIFTLPMILLSYVEPIDGFALWTSINLIGYSLYVFHFCRQNKICIPIFYHLALFLSLPVFLNFFLGQVNIIMLIALGETITELRKGHEFKAGIWLSGMLLKPQTLILFLPLFLIQKRNKVIFGLVTGSVLLIILSIIISGEAAITGPFSVISNWSTVNHQDILGDSGTSYYSLFLNLIKIIPNHFAILITLMLTILTIYLILRLWSSKNKNCKLIDDNSLLLVTYSATCTITPHSNIHMLIPLIPLFILTIQQKQMHTNVILAWIFIPTSCFLLAGLIATDLAHVAGGLSVLIVNLYIIFWNVIEVQKKISEQ